jgi:hypothetical protein
MKLTQAPRSAALRFIILNLAMLLSVRAAGADGPETAPRAISSGTPPRATNPVAVQSTNMILNGDFENTTFAPGCYFNLSNAAVNAGLPNLTAFGNAQEIDVMTDGTSCGVNDPPQSGNSKLGISRQLSLTHSGPVDAFSFDLSGPVVAGNTYTLRFYAEASTINSSSVGPVVVGISNDPTTFGTVVYSGQPAQNAWTLLGDTFTAPANASYLTVTVGNTLEGWNQIDNFSLIEGVPTSLADRTWGAVKRSYRK